MHRLPLPVASLLVLATAQGSEVFVTKDAQGRPIYTDRPDSLPAQKVKVATNETNTVEVQRQYDDKMKSYAEADQAKAEASKQAAEGQQAKELSAADKAKALSRRAYALRAGHDCATTLRAGRDRGRAALPGRPRKSTRRVNATKNVMDEFCAGQ